MDKPIAAAAVPTIPIRLKLPPDLSGRDGMQAIAVPVVTEVVADLLSKLGIPGQPEVTWEPNDEKPAAGRPLAIYANGRLCRYSDELLLLLYSYVSGKVAMSLEALNGLEAWLASAEEHLVAEWLALLCEHTLGRHAGVLLGPEQARAFCTALDLAAGGPASDPERLAPILARVLGLGISIADHAAVAAVLREGTDNGDLVGELLIAKLRPGRVEVRMERSYLRRLSLDYGERGGPELFTFLRDSLFGELGVPYPPFRIVPDDALRCGGFAIRVNHLAGVPLIGLPEDRILVNDLPDRLLTMDVTAEPAMNPATCIPCGIAPRDAQERLEAAGLTTWDPFQFLILSLAGELRAKSGRLIDRSLTQQLLDQLGRAFPELAQASRTHLCLEHLTAVLRGLVAEQISIRNLRRILELSLEHEFFVCAGAPVAERLAYVRLGLADAIARKCKRDAPALVVYLLDPAAEQAIAARQDVPDADLAQPLINAVRHELSQLRSTANWPPILVGEVAYTPLQAMIADELPRMRVLSYAQLPPDLNVQPIARIGVGG